MGKWTKKVAAKVERLTLADADRDVKSVEDAVKKAAGDKKGGKS